MSRLLVIFVFLFLAGCASPTWDAYVSHTYTMDFLTFVSCNKSTFWYPGIPAHQTYYNIDSTSSRNPDGSYFVAYAKDDGKLALRNVFIINVHYVGLQDYTAIPTSRPPDGRAAAKCGELVVLPESGAQPFDLPWTLNRHPDADVRTAGLFEVAVPLTMMLGFVFAWRGFDDTHGASDADVVLIVFGAGLVISTIAFVITAAASDKIHALLAYYSFWSSLPHTKGYVYPLSWSDAKILFAGPPYPTEVRMDFSTFYMILFAWALTWTIIAAPAIFAGLYLLFAPNPFEELRKRAAQQGRLPTPEEVMQVAQATAVGKNAYEIKLIERQAKAFNKNIL